MRKPLYAAAMLLVAATGVPQAGIAAPQPKQATGCHSQALADLKRLSPDGYAIYEAMADKKLFLVWLTCDDVQLGLATGVHESVHVLTEQRDGFPQIDGGLVRRPHQVTKFSAPKTLVRNFDGSDSYVQTYLRPGNASSADNFLYLMDELNAYSHDLNSAVKLVSLQRRDREVDHRDGLAALMSFVVSYADAAKKSQPATWDGLRQPAPKAALQTLWAQAEKVLDASCGIPGFGRKDREYIAYINNEKNNAALAEIVGKTPKISDECLAPATTSSVPRPGT